jgi:hypothetical protein
MSREEMLKIWKCEAFPNGIPDDLTFSIKIHNKPYPGDLGIIFKQNPNEEPFDIEAVAKEINDK